jgi:integrase
MRRFFEALPDCGLFQGEDVLPTYKGLFLFLASCGLRIEEAISLRKQDFYLEDRMVIPRGHENQSAKNSWVSFYSPECGKYLLPLLEKKASEDRVFPWQSTVREAFLKARKKTGIRITPQILREWFCCELGKLSIPDRYVDASCGRIPKSVLARRYTDYSPRVLKTVYEKANLRVCLESNLEPMVVDI